MELIISFIVVNPTIQFAVHMLTTGFDSLAMLACSALGGARCLLTSVFRLEVIECARNRSVVGLTEAGFIPPNPA